MYITKSLLFLASFVDHSIIQCVCNKLRECIRINGLDLSFQSNALPTTCLNEDLLGDETMRLRAEEEEQEPVSLCDGYKSPLGDNSLLTILWMHSYLGLSSSDYGGKQSTEYDDAHSRPLVDNPQNSSVESISEGGNKVIGGPLDFLPVRDEEDEAGDSGAHDPVAQHVEDGFVGGANKFEALDTATCTGVVVNKSADINTISSIQCDISTLRAGYDCVNKIIQLLVVESGKDYNLALTSSFVSSNATTREIESHFVSFGDRATYYINTTLGRNPTYVIWISLHIDNRVHLLPLLLFNPNHSVGMNLFDTYTIIKYGPPSGVSGHAGYLDTGIELHTGSVSSGASVSSGMKPNAEKNMEEYSQDVYCTVISMNTKKMKKSYQFS